MARWLSRVRCRASDNMPATFPRPRAWPAAPTPLSTSPNFWAIGRGCGGGCCGSGEFVDGSAIFRLQVFPESAQQEGRPRQNSLLVGLPHLGNPFFDSHASPPYRLTVLPGQLWSLFPFAAEAY